MRPSQCECTWRTACSPCTFIIPRFLLDPPTIWSRHEESQDRGRPGRTGLDWGYSTAPSVPTPVKGEGFFHLQAAPGEGSSPGGPPRFVRRMIRTAGTRRILGSLKRGRDRSPPRHRTHRDPARGIGSRENADPVRPSKRAAFLSSVAWSRPHPRDLQSAAELPDPRLHMAQAILATLGLGVESEFLVARQDLRQPPALFDQGHELFSRRRGFAIRVSIEQIQEPLQHRVFSFDTDFCASLYDIHSCGIQGKCGTNAASSSRVPAHRPRSTWGGP
jgi:hypothetical protein